PRVLARVAARLLKERNHERPQWHIAPAGIANNRRIGRASDGFQRQFGLVARGPSHRAAGAQAGEDPVAVAGNRASRRRLRRSARPSGGAALWKEGGYLLFSDIHNNKRMKYEPGKGVSLFLEPTNRANGLTRDLQGRLLACEHDTRRVTRLELDGSLTVLANTFQGRQLNRPNDVVVKSDGCIYFTDPWTSPLAPEQWDLTFSGVYRLTPDLGTYTL